MTRASDGLTRLRAIVAAGLMGLAFPGAGALALGAGTESALQPRVNRTQRADSANRMVLSASSALPNKEAPLPKLRQPRKGPGPAPTPAVASPGRTQPLTRVLAQARARTPAELPLRWEDHLAPKH